MFFLNNGRTIAVERINMNKRSNILVVILVVIVLAGGGYLLFHKSKTSNNSSTTNSTAVVNNTVLTTKSASGQGEYLADVNDHPLYTYGGDTSGTSNCDGSCLASWPAYQDNGATTGLPSGVGTIKRKDTGQTQFTYHGMPLYTFVGDNNGQATGNGLSNFSLARP